MNTVWPRLLAENLGARPGESLLVLADDARPACAGWANDVAEAGRAAGLDVRTCVYPSLGGHGREPPEAAWRAAWGDGLVDDLRAAGLIEPLLAKRASEAEIAAARARAAGRAGEAVRLVVALAHFSTSHTIFRRLLAECAGARYASMPLFDEAMVGPLGVPPAELVPPTRRLVAALEGGRRARVRCPAGTDLSLDISGRAFHADDGDLSAPGAFGNLPAGEAYCAPVEGTAEGTLAITCAPTRRLASTVRVRIERGAAVAVEGDEAYADDLRRILRATPDWLRVAELGIGTNPRAARPENVLEAEKIAGSVHIAFGDNASFGGTLRVPFHVDHVVFGATLEVDGRTLLEEGRPLW